MRFGRKPDPFVCTNCKKGECVECVDVLRMVYTNNEICKCTRRGHSGDPIEQQILDPETGSVHGPNVIVKHDGTVEFPNSITCPRCKRTSHNPNDIKEKYCGNCHQFHDMMEL